MKTIKQSYRIKAPIEKVWQALTDPKVIEEWGGGPAKMSEKEDFKFEFWGGDIYGKNLRVVKQKELVQEWTAEHWNKPSKVIFKLKSVGDGTVLELIHENVPDKSAKGIDQGWKD